MDFGSHLVRLFHSLKLFKNNLNENLLKVRDIQLSITLKSGDGGAERARANTFEEFCVIVWMSAECCVQDCSLTLRRV